MWWICAGGDGREGRDALSGEVVECHAAWSTCGVIWSHEWIAVEL